MSTPESVAPEPVPAEGTPQPEFAPGATPATSESERASSAQPDDAQPEVVRTEVQVELRRTVRWGRLLAVGAIIGVVVAALLSLSFPVMEDADYTLAQVTGFMAIIGGALGLAVGGLLAIVLNQVAKRRHGRGVAIQTDVR
ncbi:hypothetical protein [Leucobacter sp. GX24907]